MSRLFRELEAEGQPGGGAENAQTVRANQSYAILAGTVQYLLLQLYKLRAACLGGPSGVLAVLDL